MKYILNQIYDSIYIYTNNPISTINTDNPTNNSLTDSKNPFELDGGFISSILENGELNSPLEGLLSAQFDIIVVIFFFILMIISILFNLYFIQNDVNQQRLFSLIDRVFNTKISGKLKYLLQRGSKFSRITMFTLLIYNFIFLLFLVLANMYFTYDLYNDIDTYVSGYNATHTNIIGIVNKSDILGFLSNLIDNYYIWLSTLSLDKIVAVFNIIIDSVLLVNLFTVISLLMGEHLIDFFKLDVKYPKLAKLIRLKNTVNKYYKTMHLGFYILFLCFGILGNAFMFCIEYII